MLSGILKLSGLLILRIVYGKEYSEEYSQKTSLVIFLSLVNCLWLLCSLFLIAGMAVNDTVFCAIIAIGYPVAIIVWAVMTRKKQRF